MSDTWFCSDHCSVAGHNQCSFNYKSFLIMAATFFTGKLLCEQ